MRLGVLFSGGKDSCLALWKAMAEHEIACLVTLISKNPESYMFHVPNIHMAEMQAEAIGLPIIKKETPGVKEEELVELKQAIQEAKEKYRLKGITTGAIQSEYQKSRIQKICDELQLKCINPLWQKNQLELLKELVQNKFEAIISGIFAYGLKKELLGKRIDNEVIAKLEQLKVKMSINPAGEGGEIETTVLDAPFFRKRIAVKEFEIQYGNDSGVFLIKKANLEKK